MQDIIDNEGGSSFFFVLKLILFESLVEKTADINFS